MSFPLGGANTRFPEEDPGPTGRRLVLKGPALTVPIDALGFLGSDPEEEVLRCGGAPVAPQSSGSFEKALFRIEIQLRTTTDVQPMRPAKNIHCKTLFPQSII